MYGIVFVMHVLAATVWTGGHLVLALTVLPRALRNKAVDELLRFESGFERIGVPALIVQGITGIWLAFHMVPSVSELFDHSNPVSRLISLKLLLLAVTVGLAIDARLRVIPKLSEKNLRSLAWHILAVTVVSVLLVIAGVSFRTGWFS